MKKGQIYILSVLIIGFLLFTIITPSNFIHQKVIDDDFKELSQNYQLESSKLINELLNKEGTNEEVISDTFLNFTVVFTSYSKTKNPNFGLIYAFPYGGEVFIGNYADTDLKFTAGNSLVTHSLPGCFSKVSTSVSLYGISLSPDIYPASYATCIKNIPYPQDNKIKFNIEGIEYDFELKNSRSDIIIVSRESLQDDIKVFISD